MYEYMLNRGVYTFLVQDMANAVSSLPGNYLKSMKL